MDYVRYSAVLEPDEEEPHRYNAQVPALPGGLSNGESIENAWANALGARWRFPEHRTRSGGKR
ncbi:MAG: hypothetical protein H0U10_07040 [Chloroflexia bacterium]|nr:hypothetical protein [Chloroflexia bacterium]